MRNSPSTNSSDESFGTLRAGWSTVSYRAFCIWWCQTGCLIAKYPCSDEACVVEVVYADLVGVSFGGNCGRDYNGNALVAEWHYVHSRRLMWRFCKGLLLR